MGSDLIPESKRSTSAGSSAAAGPYQPRNNIHSTTKPTYSGSQHRTLDSLEAANPAYYASSNDRPSQPKFGSTTPMKNTLPARSIPWEQQQNSSKPTSRPDFGNQNRNNSGVDSVRRPHVSDIQLRRDQFMQPIRAGAPKEQWRTKPVTVDLTAADDAIQMPSNMPSFATPQRSGFQPVNKSNVVDLTQRAPPPSFNLPTGGRNFGAPEATYYAGNFVDAAKTTESIKELLEGTFDNPVSKKKKKKSKAVKKEILKEDAELAEMMAGAGLTESKIEAETKVKEEPEEEEEEEGEEDDGEEEEDSHVEGLNVTLLPHQIRGLDFLLKREEGKNRGGILADDMGLGKTIQSISLILSHPHPRYPVAEGATFTDLSPSSKKKALDIPSDIGRGTLVIAPLALIKQWEGEIANRTEQSHRLRVIVHHGPNRAKDSRVLKKYDVVITTYDTIRSEHQKSGSDLETGVGVFGIRWWRIICDEAHTIKNRAAKSTIAACAIKARYRWCLTGTPLQNNLDELQSLLHFLKIGPFDDIAVWKDQITRPMQQNKGGVAIERLRVVLGAIMLRRTKAVLMKDAEGRKGNQIKLMERKMEKMVAEFNAQEQTFYDKLEERTEESLEKMLSGFGDFGGKLGGNNMTSALVLLLRLRQACNHPHLLAGKIHKDKDASMALSTPRKKKAPKPNVEEEPAEEDELADLMGGLSVDQKKCEVCLRSLTRTEIDGGELRCGDCNADLNIINKPNEKRKTKKRVMVKTLKKIIKVKKQPVRKRRTVFDSDDEFSEEEKAEESEYEEVYEEQSFFEDSQAEETDDDGSASDFDDSSYSSLVPSTKIDSLLDIIKKEKREKNKIIVFSQFTSMLDIIEPFLHNEGIVFTRYDGSMKNDDREASLRRLRGEGEFAPRSGKEDKDWCGVLLCSLKCGALGLNLTCASRVVILEPFWNPFIEEQAIDRVHRIGQTKDVIVYKITIANSVEERILQLQDRKRELAKAAIGDGDMAGKAKAAKMSMKDILFLFRRDAEHGAREDTHLNQRTKILKERRPAPSLAPAPLLERENRYRSPSEEAAREARRAREFNSVYSRR